MPVSHDVLKAERPATIALVEDDPELTVLLERWLTEAGYRVMAFADGTACLRAMVRDQADAVCLDVNLPLVDGLSVLGALKARLERRGHLPILMLTSETAPEVRQRALAMGASDFMAKPCDRAELLLRLRNHLRLRFASLDLAEQNLVLDGMMRHQAWSAEDARGQLVERLTRAAEYRDDETGAHARRVGHLAGRLGWELGLARPDLDLLQAAAPLHDVGKIAIPDVVLHKRGGLTDEERATMGAHTAIGAELLGGSRIPALELAAVIARTHHEWWDGSGAGGIRGENIPVAGRIVAVADVYDALTSERPYKPAWPVADAFAEISAGSGTRFDPAVVAALAAVLTDDGHDLTNGRHPEAGATYAHSC